MHKARARLMIFTNGIVKLFPNTSHFRASCFHIELLRAINRARFSSGHNFSTRARISTNNCARGRTTLATLLSLHTYPRNTVPAPFTCCWRGENDFHHKNWGLYYISAGFTRRAAFNIRTRGHFERARYAVIGLTINFNGHISLLDCRLQ